MGDDQKQPSLSPTRSFQNERVEQGACPQCGKYFDVAIVEVPGLKHWQSVNCPYCGTADAFTANCSSAIVRSPALRLSR